MMSCRKKVLNLISNICNGLCRCPAHSTYNSYTNPMTRQTDYAFEMACSTIRYGPGVTKEVGYDIKNMNLSNILVMTDPKISDLAPLKDVVESLTQHAVNFTCYTGVEVEPTDESFKKASEICRNGQFDGIIAVGGGSVIDTAKAANLYSSDPDSDFLDYVNPPIGKGKPVTVPLKPLIAVPTTSGTGSETTGVAIFDFKSIKTKTGIASRRLRPTLGLVDPLHTLSMPRNVAIYSGFDVLCHALESYTALSYTERQPMPSNPIDRPAYQGRNPMSDIWAKAALSTIAKYFKRSIINPEDIEARSAMHLASAYAGAGFGNAGVHLCHGMSYPVSGLVKSYKPVGYSQRKPIIPHGLSVVMTSPAVFSFTSSMCPERHLEVAYLLGKDITNVKKEDAGKILSDTLREYMSFMDIENGLQALGFSEADLPKLVKGTLPQHRVTKLAPRQQSEEDLYQLFENSLRIY